MHAIIDLKSIDYVIGVAVVGPLCWGTPCWLCWKVSCGSSHFLYSQCCSRRSAPRR